MLRKNQSSFYRFGKRKRRLIRGELVEEKILWRVNEGPTTAKKISGQSNLKAHDSVKKKLHLSSKLHLSLTSRVYFVRSVSSLPLYPLPRC